ncbi:fluoride efflux transporter CrcB [Bacillus sp. ISL-77]|uniref:fluoride efflux transporter CrcB n=1 Tax=Bacillus sp. ISL-77 TaxID=2819138 RepID=UPI001BECAFE7|nr:fluoride efflux transporter CrcB [Bacillus sp. ISL-77]MBT2739973.1 fluoride efflux transporter CrcB [Bacillus sp. ISL-77]
MIYFWVGIAGTLGAILRYMIGASLFTNSTFPYATLIINLIGSFLLAGLTTNLFKWLSISPVIATSIGTGFVGSFTTFSTLSVETVKLFQVGNIVLGLAYVFVSILGGLAMSRLGFKVSQEVQES